MNISFQWIGGAACIIQVDSYRIAVDPVLCPKGTVQDYFWFKSRRVEGPRFRDEDYKDVNLWLLTHNHLDHLDEEGLEKIKQSLEKSGAKFSDQSDGVEIICSGDLSGRLQKEGLNSYKVLQWGQKNSFKKEGLHIEVEAVPAVHGVNPLAAKLAGRGNGYYISIFKEGVETPFHMYLTGDTVYKEKVMKTLDGKKVDFLIPNMGAAKQGSWIMTLTLNAKMLQKIIARLKPTKVIPVHFGTFAHYKEPGRAIEALNEECIEMLQPGERVCLPEMD
jgi:L-ascorbate metabolism protein UlaG (beta-lactamase superfamily)